MRVDESELEFSFVRSSGAGGQNVNKVSSKAVLRWNILTSAIPEAVRKRFLAKWPEKVSNSGDVIITSSRYRDQLKNKEDALAKLEALLAAVAKPPKLRRKTQPTRASKERRLKDKKRRSALKSQRRDYSGD